MIERVTIIGTGLIGASIGLALREAGFAGERVGIDANLQERLTALRMGAVDRELAELPAASASIHGHVIVLAVPVLAILDWMHRLAPLHGIGQMVTDVGSTKLDVANAARQLFNRPGGASFLPGHPMAGKESGGAALADASLFREAMWLFTPVAAENALTSQWRRLISGFGARTMDMDPQRHDELCAWVSHLPQMLSTALAALLEEKIGDASEIAAIGGRALRETTRLGASPYSMWRDVAMTNGPAIAAALLALEQRLAHMRENLRTPELRDEFLLANKFRRPR